MDFIVAIEFNRDVNYFSNIVESLSRDLHCYVIQANASHYGDSRIVKPASREVCDIVRVKGGKTPVVMVSDIDIESLRNFNRRAHNLKTIGSTIQPEFKPTPACFEWEWVERRIRNEKITSKHWF